MTEERGLTIGTKAPLIATKDIFDSEINLESLLNEDYRGILIEFIRGAW